MKLVLTLLAAATGLFFGSLLQAQQGKEVLNAEKMALPNRSEATPAEMISPDTIQFPNNPVSDFLLVYEKLKGVTLIKDASLLAGSANLSLTLNQPVSKAEAIRLWSRRCF